MRRFKRSNHKINHKINLNDLEKAIPAISIKGLSIGSKIVNEMMDSVIEMKEIAASRGKKVPSFIKCKKCQLLVPHTKCD